MIFILSLLLSLVVCVNLYNDQYLVHDEKLFKECFELFFGGVEYSLAIGENGSISHFFLFSWLRHRHMLENYGVSHIILVSDS